MIELESGRKILFAGEPIKRPVNSPTPCDRCPKCDGEKVKDPTTGRKATLSARNVRTFLLYMQLRASGGRALPEQVVQDPIFARNIGLIESIISTHDRNVHTGLLKALIAKP